MKKLTDFDIASKKILARVDCNVPLDADLAITDETRIQGILPMVRYCIEKGAKLILMSHLGRPKDGPEQRFSLKPVADRLSEILHRPIPLAPDCIGAEVASLVAAMQPGDLLFLENLRFHPEEKENDPAFCEKLAAFADIYINDAFAVSHRAHASVVGVPLLVPQRGAGFLLAKEMDYFNRAIRNPERPFAAVVGGAKVSSKLAALENMLERVDTMVIGGAMANTFLKSQGIDVGASLVEEDLLETSVTLITRAKERGVHLFLPVDAVAAETFDAAATSRVVTVQDTPPGWMLVDIGPATRTLFAEALAGAATIVWNGPMGAFEMAPFSAGTTEMVKILNSSQALTIVGGGDTNAAVNQSGVGENISYMSTGGGAFLMLMEGKALPGVEVLG